jgi:alkaline phosphatase D
VPPFRRNPFTLGVASGAPLPTAVVIWTRLAPRPLDGGGVGNRDVTVDWEVATDERFLRIVRRGRVRALPAQAHSVRVDVRRLEPDHRYFFRFRAGDRVSPVGRTRTAPAPNAGVASLRFGVASCQHFEVGFFGAYRHVLAEDVDVMAFLGDYIYEGPARPERVRMHIGDETQTLAEYRNRHAQYKTDPDLQRLHAAVPWLVTWDDHEVDNDYAADQASTLAPGFLRRRTAAYQAYFEHMPVRGPAPRVHRRYDWGSLARIHVLDGRQFRTPQACPGPGRGGSRFLPFDEDCPELADPARTMLGREQERWLRAGISASPDRWHVIAQQTLMTQAIMTRDGRQGIATDSWDGYPQARRRLLEHLRDRRARSCLVVTGDRHVNYVADLKVDFDDPDAEPVATEFCGTSVTSPMGQSVSEVAGVVRDNPHIHHGDPTQRGYMVVELTPQRALARMRVIDDPTDRVPGVATQATFTIEAGRPGAQPVP